MTMICQNSERWWVFHIYVSFTWDLRSSSYVCSFFGTGWSPNAQITVWAADGSLPILWVTKRSPSPAKIENIHSPLKEWGFTFLSFWGWVYVCTYIYILLSPLLGVFIWFNPPSLRMARGGLNMSFKPNRYRTHTHMYSTNYCMCHLYLYIYIYILKLYIYHSYLYRDTCFFSEHSSLFLVFHNAT